MKGLGKRILVMAAVTAVCVWAAGQSGYAVKPIRLDETELAQQVQTLKENNLTKFSGVTIYDGIVIGVHYLPSMRSRCPMRSLWALLSLFQRMILSLIHI